MDRLPLASQRGTRASVPGSMFCDKVRIRFHKGGDLRLVSHHDLLRCFERMLRRAELPVHTTQGFNPRPRLAFASALPLGVVGCEEIVELELSAALEPDAIHERLARQAPPGLRILSVERIARKTVAHVCGAVYRLPLPAGRAEATRARAAELLELPQCWVERVRPEPRRIDIKPYLRDFRVDAHELEMNIRVTPNGSAKPNEVVALLGLGDLLEAGVVVERVRLELADESHGVETNTPTAAASETGQLALAAIASVGTNDKDKGNP